MFGTSTEPEYRVTVLKWKALSNLSASAFSGVPIRPAREELLSLTDIPQAVGMLKLLVGNANDEIRSREYKGV